MFGAHPMFRIGGAAGYQIPYSLRFRASNSAYLSRTFGSPTSSTIWTFSAWVKRGLLASTRYLLGASTTTNFGFNSSDQLTLTLNGVTACTSTAVFRDPTAWMHVVYQQNGSAQTIYVNGSSVATGTTAAAVFNTAIAHQIGAANTTNFLDGYMAEVNFIDGQALTPSSFGYTAGSVWVPKQYAGTYGSNGFYLKFADATTTTTIGNDSSGNANNWTTSGISVTSGTTFDQMTDTPTLNYCVLNPLNRTGSASAPTNANMTSPANAGNWRRVGSTIQIPATGKWYFEYVCDSFSSFATFNIGVFSGQMDTAANVPGYLSTEWCYDGQTGCARNNNVQITSGFTTATTNDILQLAYDADAGKLWFGKNNTWQGSGTPSPSSGTGETYSGVANVTALVVQNWATQSVNFGQRTFSYTPPTGFKALNTQNVTSTAVTVSGSFTGNAAADGPFIWTNGNPATLTINGNPVTFGTDADKTAGGFKLRTSSASYNASGTNNWTATAGKRFVQARKPNNAQVNP